MKNNTDMEWITIHDVKSAVNNTVSYNAKAICSKNSIHIDFGSTATGICPNACSLICK